ncbi:MAG: TlpA family protein disulfide reductase [Bacteroides sp.]|nr:TlpA family protein disulfide reductase [Bacteroides sp.]
MKKVSFLIFCLFALCGIASKAQEVAADSTGYIVKVGEMAPDFTVKLTDGKSVALSALRGKVVMLQFTASWCGVCRKEMPFIEKEIWQKHKSNPDFMLIGIDRDEPLEKVIAFGKSIGVTYPLGLDPGADIFAKYALRKAGITRNVLIDKEGRIVKLTRLYNPEEFASLVKEIDEMMSE